MRDCRNGAIGTSNSSSARLGRRKEPAARPAFHFSKSHSSNRSFPISGQFVTRCKKCRVTCASDKHAERDIFLSSVVSRHSSSKTHAHFPKEFAIYPWTRFP